MTPGSRAERPCFATVAIAGPDRPVAREFRPTQASDVRLRGARKQAKPEVLAIRDCVLRPPGAAIGALPVLPCGHCARDRVVCTEEIIPVVARLHLLEPVEGLRRVARASV